MRSRICVVIIALTPVITYAQQAANDDGEEGDGGDEEQTPAEEYVEAGSLEIGGAISASIDDDTATITASPTVGYFIADRVELSAIVAFSYNRVEDELTGTTDSTTTGSLILEPSYHHPIGDDLLIAAGFGVGAGYDGEHFDLGIIPSLGIEIMTSRSNLITPTLRLPITVGESPGPEDDISTRVALAFEVGISTTW